MTNRAYHLPRTAILTLFFAAFAQAGDPAAYVSSFAQNFISTLNPDTGLITKVANAGANAANFVISPDGTTAYVVSETIYPSSTGSLNVVSLATGKIVSTISGIAPGGLSNVALSRDGSLLYFVGSQGLTVVDTATGSLVAATPLNTCPCLVASPVDGSSIYVASVRGLLIFNGTTYLETGSIGTSYVEGIALSPDGTKLYLVTPGQNTLVSVLDTSTNTVIGALPFPNTFAAAGAAVSPDGETLYVGSPGGLLRICTSPLNLIDEISSPALSNQITPSPDGQYVYVNRVIAPQQEDSVSNTVPGLLRFDTTSATFLNMSIGGAAVAEQIPTSGNQVYVLEASYNVSTEDPVAETITQVIGSVNGTYALAESSSGNLVAGVSEVSLSGLQTASISLIDTNSHRVTGQFTYAPQPPEKVYPFSLALNGGGTLAYLGTSNSKASEPSVSVIQLPQGRVQASIPIVTTQLSPPVFLLASPDGSSLFVLLSAYQVCKVSLSTYATLGCANYSVQLPGGASQASATALAISSDGTRLYVPALESKAQFDSSPALFLISIDTASMKVVQGIQINSLPGTGAVAYSGATNSLYLTQGDVLFRVDLSSFTLALTQRFNYTPLGLAVTPDGTRLLVTGSPHGTQIFDGATLAPIGSIAGGQQQAIVIAPQ